MTKTCLICGYKFRPDHAIRNGHCRKYCSDKCSKKAKNEQARLYERRKHPRVNTWDGEHCVLCGIEFEGRRRKFCTKEHADKGVK